MKEVCLYTDGACRGNPGPGDWGAILVFGKFEKEKLIEETEVDGRKRTYRITSKGLEAYREETERLRRCLRIAEGGED